MRITDLMMVNNSIKQINQNQDKMAALQEKASTGKAFQTYSDDPATVSLAISLRTTIQASQSFIDTANVTNDWMSATDSSLTQMSDLGTKASNLALSGEPDTMGPEQKQALATKIDGILKNAIDIGNTYNAGRYIYGGYQVSKPPFQAVTDPATGQITSVAYQGDNGVINRNIGPEQTVTINVNGQSAFSAFFKSLIDARDALNANNSAAIQTAQGNLTAASSTVRQYATINGGNQNTVQNALDHLGRTQQEIKTLLSQKEDANVAEAISMLQNQQSTYQISLEVGQRAISALSLFDVLK